MCLEVFQYKKFFSQL